MTTKSINYGELTETEALDILKTEQGEKAVAEWTDRNQIISAKDVLYFVDAYGDLEDAILLQSWDKSLPDRVHRGLLDSGLDIYEAVNNHDLEKERCPSCDRDMWRFEIRTGTGHTQSEWVDEWGDVTSDYVEFVEQPENNIWNAGKEDGHAPVLCDACGHDAHRDFPRNASDSGSVRIHYGETDEISGFSVNGNLVRWDYESYFGGNMTDLWGLPGGHEDGLPSALVSGSVPDWLDESGWTEIASDTVKEDVSKRVRIKTRTFGKEYRRIAEEWAEGDETHPDLDFTYVIDFATFGSPSFFVAEENKAALLAEIGDLIERRV